MPMWWFLGGSPVLFAFLATGGSLAAALLALVNLIIAVAIWSVFVIIANRYGQDVEKDELEDADLSDFDLD